MSRGYQYNYSAIADDLYDLNFRQNKAKKTISILVDYLGDTNHLSLLDIDVHRNYDYGIWKAIPTSYWN